MGAPYPGKRCYLGTDLDSLASIEDSLTNAFSAFRVAKTGMDTAGLLTPDVMAASREGRLPVISWRSEFKGLPVKWWEMAANKKATDTWLVAQRNMFQANPFVNAILVYSPTPDDADEVLSYGRYRAQDVQNAADYNAALNHIQDVFDGNGGTPNVRFATVTTGGNITGAGGAWARAYLNTRAYYVGASVASTQAGVTPSFGDITASIRSAAVEMAKPVVLPDVGCWYQPDDPNVRVAFLEDITDVVEDWPELKLWSYSNALTDTDDWRLTTQAESLAAMDELLAYSDLFVAV